MQEKGGSTVEEKFAGDKKKWDHPGNKECAVPDSGRNVDTPGNSKAKHK